MEQLRDRIRKVKSEELLQRFRSKEDIYKYLTNQMRLYLPSQKGTKLSFLRAILDNTKKALKQSEVSQSSIPHYEEISVKNLYHDAMNDPILRNYLPELEQNSNRFPEREFFFGILGTLKPDYLKKIIEDANKNRYTVNEQDPKQDFIMIDDQWYQELIKHPFYSKKPGKAIFLMKQRSKLVRAKKNVHKFQVSQRLSHEEYKQGENKENEYKVTKRRKVAESGPKNMEIVEQPPIQQRFNI